MDLDPAKILFTYVQHKMWDALEEEIKQGANINIQDPDRDNDTPLHTATRFGDYISTFLLIQGGADPNTQNDKGDTPLTLASRIGHTKIVNDLLLMTKVNILLQNEKGNDALIYAQEPEIIELLLSYWPDLEYTTNYGNVLHVCVMKNRPDFLNYFLREGANIKAVNENDETPLSYAIRIPYDTDELIALLLKYNADVSLADKNQDTPIVKSILAKKSYLIPEFIKLGADPTQSLQMFLSTQPKATPENLLIFQTLVEYGADPSSFVNTVQNKNIKEFLSARSKPLTVSKNFPVVPNIYVPLGHGSERNMRRIIPAGNMFISFGTCGLMTKAQQEGYAELLADVQLKTLNKVKEFYGHPIANQKKIQAVLNRSEMYIKAPPRDTLPNISYTLLSFWNEPSQSRYEVSGLVPLEKMNDPEFNFYEQTIEFTDDVKGEEFYTKTFPELFRFSVKPSYNKVKAAFESKEAIMKTLQFTTIKNWKEVAELIPKLPMFEITLYKLMDEFPGIYYHFVCRGPFENVSNSRYQSSAFPMLRQLSNQNKLVNPKTYKNALLKTKKGGKRKTRKNK
jgi:ankyrin repeat protein